MSELFSDIMYDLTDKEKQLIPKFVKGFNSHVGRENAITSNEIMAKIPGLNGARIRKIVNYIRVNYLVLGLMASSSGYYISKDREEIKEYIQSLGHREAAIGRVRKSMEEYLQTL